MTKIDSFPAFASVIQRVLPDAAFNAEMDTNAKYIQDVFKNPTVGFTSMLVMKTSKDHRMVFMLPDLPEDNAEKQKVLYDIGERIGADDAFSDQHGFVLAIYFMSEAWMRSFDKGEKVQYPIRDLPSKTEVMIATGMTVDKRTNMAMYPMLRAKANGIVFLDTKHATISPYDPKDKNHSESSLLSAVFQGYVDGIRQKEVL